MPLFDDIERVSLDVPQVTESRFSYLNTSARPSAAAVRDFLTRSLADYPEDGRADLTARLRSTDTTFESTVFELIVHQLLIRSGHKILAIEPVLPGTTKRPDFLVAAPDGSELIVECVVANGRSEQALGADKRLNAALEAIAKTPSKRHVLSVSIEGAAGAVITTRVLRRTMTAWIAALPDGIAAHAAPDFVFEEHGLILTVSVLAARRRPFVDGERSVAAIHYPIRAAQPGEDVRGSLIKKANRYGDLGKPYVIAVGDLSGFHGEEHLMDALLGSPVVVFNQNVPGGDPRPARADDGLWINGHRPRKRGVSGVLYLSGVDAWRPWGRTIRFVTNPWATYPLGDSSLPVPKLLPIEGEFRKVEGQEGPELFGLDDQWLVE